MKSSGSEPEQPRRVQRHLVHLDEWRPRPLVAPIISVPYIDNDMDKKKEDTLYGKKFLSLEKWGEFKQSLFGLLDHAVVTLTNYEKRPFPQSHTRLVLRCTDELLDLVYSHRVGVIDENILEILGVACFFISMKLFYAYDFITEYLVMDGIVKIFVRMERPKPPPLDGSKQSWKDFDKKLEIYNKKLGKKRTEIMEKLIEMEINIMKRTDWKGCKAYSLDKIYDDEDAPSWMFGAVKKSVRKSKSKKSVRKSKSKKSVRKSKSKSKKEKE